MNPIRLARQLAPSLMAAALLAACGGSNNSGTGTLRLSLTDAPACGYDNVWVTVERVRVHQSSTAGDGDGGWSEVALATPARVDLLTLTNGTLLPLGETPLPAGRYTQMRLVLAPNTPSDPLANSIAPTGGTETALTTPSGQQSGLKMNVNIDVAADQIADFAIDFNACKSFVRAGNSGRYLLKPVLSVIPILSDAGQRIVGHVDLALANSGASVSVQQSGVPVRATPPDPVTGQFVLYPVPAGDYDLVITAAGRVNAVMTGVPVITTAHTIIGSSATPIDTPASANSYVASGTLTVNASSAGTSGLVVAKQTLAGGPTVEVGAATADDLSGAYRLLLPADPPARLAYVAGATTFGFASDATGGNYTLEASVPDFAAQSALIALTGDVMTNFSFPLAP